jgi:hypothetical protein
MGTEIVKGKYLSLGIMKARRLAQHSDRAHICGCSCPTGGTVPPFARGCKTGRIYPEFKHIMKPVTPPSGNNAENRRKVFGLEEAGNNRRMEKAAE